MCVCVCMCVCMCVCVCIVVVEPTPNSNNMCNTNHPPRHCELLENYFMQAFHLVKNLCSAYLMCLRSLPLAGLLKRRRALVGFCSDKKAITRKCY